MGGGDVTGVVAGRILVVEDDPEIRRLIAAPLARMGYVVATAPHGEAALTQLRSAPIPELIILDLYMPVMDGWEFRTAQLADAALAAIPVVVVSAADDALIAPIDAAMVVRKPIDLHALAEIAARFCSAKVGA